jgi:hypothetical protein
LSWIRVNYMSSDLRVDSSGNWNEDLFCRGF